MGDAVIVSTARTPIGIAYKGSLALVDPFELATVVVAEAVARSGLDPASIDDVVMGESLYGGGDIARYAAIEAGLEHVPGLALNRHCAAGLSAVVTAAASIRSDMDRAVVAGGVQSTSTMPMGQRRDPRTGEVQPWMSPSHRDRPDAPSLDMSITVGWNAAVEAGVTREQMDAWAFRSHQRAIAAIDSGVFAEEIVAVDVPDGAGGTRSFAVDEHPRRGSTMEKLGALAPIHPEIEDFSITAGNSSGLNDGAAAMVLVDGALADAQGLEPLAVVRGWASVGVAPERTGLSPTVVIPKVLERVGLTVDDIDLWEINEAFASVCVATTSILGIDERIVNVLGSGCSLGHPIAMTGARMVMSLTHELRRRGGGVAVAAMCAGGGMGTAVVLEVPAG
jgi:acetyl-CoA acetyltransferase family protein